MKKNICALLLTLCLVIGGCSTEKIDYLETSISRLENGIFYVGCPIDDGDGDDQGYNCMVIVNSDTKLKSSTGEDLKFEDFIISDKVKVIFKEPQVIDKKHLSIHASEIHLISR